MRKVCILDLFLSTVCFLLDTFLDFCGVRTIEERQRKLSYPFFSGHCGGKGLPRRLYCCTVGSDMWVRNIISFLL